MTGKIHNLLVYSVHNRAFAQAASVYLRDRLIDIGCGTKVYHNLLAPYVDEHVGLNHEETIHDKSNIDIFGSAYKIPIADDSFDSPVCAAVLEHLQEPVQALRGCHRILKPSGVAIYYVPFIWHLHEEPQDFYRHPKYGLEYLFRKVELEIINIRALSGFWVTFNQLFVYSYYRLNRGPLRWFRIMAAIGLLIRGFAYILDRIEKSEQWTWIYMAVAKKPDVA